MPLGATPEMLNLLIPDSFSLCTGTVLVLGKSRLVSIIHAISSGGVN